jgi:hypothetical protein
MRSGGSILPRRCHSTSWRSHCDSSPAVRCSGIRGCVRGGNNDTNTENENEKDPSPKVRPLGRGIGTQMDVPREFDACETVVLAVVVRSGAAAAAAAAASVVVGAASAVVASAASASASTTAR